MNEDIFTTAQAAERLGICQRSVIYLITKGHLEASRFGWAYVITEEALADYLRRKAAGEVPSAGRPRKSQKGECGII